MRYYSLEIAGKESFKLDNDNPWGININFQIMTCMDVRTAMPTTIELLNAPLDFFTNTPDLKGSTVILNGGIKEAGYTSAQKLKTPTSYRPLLCGQVNNYFASWELTETRATISVSYMQPAKDEWSFIIKKGDIIGKVVCDYLTRMSALNKANLLFKVDPSAYKCIFENNTSINYRFIKDKDDDTDLIKKAAEFLSSFDLKIKYENSTYTIYQDNELENINIKSYITVYPSQLLSQPNYDNAASVAISIGLDSRIALGSVIFIPTDLQMFSGSLLGDFGGVILRNTLDAKILRQGLYRVNEIMHIGDSRNVSPTAWSTNMKCNFIGKV